MTTRRARGEGSLYWDEARQRWIAAITVGYTPAGKRIVRKGSGKTKTEARTKLREKSATTKTASPWSTTGTPWPMLSKTGSSTD